MLLPQSLPPYQFFGSEDSKDIDVAFFIAQMPSNIQECAMLNKNYCKALVDLYQYAKPVNGNLAIVANGQLVKVFKGTVDELSNALFYTYTFHQQHFTNKIDTLLARNIDLKFLRCSRTILSYFTKTAYRKEIKNALQQNIDVKYEVLKSNYFLELLESQIDTDMLKSIAFQLGQTLGLEEGQEFYTKSAIATYYPALQPYLLRTAEADKSSLIHTFLHFVERLEQRRHNMTKKVEDSPV